MTPIPQINYNTDNMEPIITGGERIVPESKPPKKEERKLVITTPEETEKQQAMLPIQPYAEIAEKNGRVSIIILAWNQLHYTKICIESIKKHTDREKYDLIVIDQGSTDKTLEYLKEALDGSGDMIIRNTVNSGFSGGNNQGLQIAKSEYILMLNNDCKVKKEGWLDLLLDASKNDDSIGLLGAFCMKAAPDYAKKLFDHVGVGKESEEWSYIEGWCLFGKRDLFQKLGGFDMRFNPAYGEDSDLSFRVKAMGLKIKAVKLPIKHYGSKSKSQLDSLISDQGDRSKRLMFRKWILKTKEMGENEMTKNIQTAPIKSLNPEKPKVIVDDERKFTILFRRKGARGDVLLTTPIVRELKKKYPKSFLVYETDCPDVVKDNPYIDRIEKCVSKPDSYDIILTPLYRYDMSKNAIDVMAKTCRVELSSKKIEIYLTADQIRWAKNKLDSSKQHIAFHTGRAWPSKEWEIDKFRDVIQHYKNEGYGVIEIGNKQTQYTGVGTNCRGCSIKQTAALIKECCVFVGIDSACAHLAKAVGTPACVIYGSVDPSSPKSDAVEYPIWLDDLECKGCRGRTSALWVECCKPEVYCLTRITPEMVIETVDKCLFEQIK